MERTGRVGGLVVLACSALLVSACGSPSGSSVPSVSSASPAVLASPAASGPPSAAATGSAPAARPAAPASAREAVTGYVQALRRRDAAAARSYLAPEYQQQRDAAQPRFEDWVADVVSARLLRVAGAIPESDLQRRYPGYGDQKLVAATYDMAVRPGSRTHDDEAPTGAHTRFFHVGRSSARGTWMILDIGTGP